jgi:hypothetical protein
LIYTYFDPSRPEGQAERIRDWDLHFTALGYATKLLTIRHALRSKKFRGLSKAHRKLWAPIYALKALGGGLYSHEANLNAPSRVKGESIGGLIGRMSPKRAHYKKLKSK